MAGLRLGARLPKDQATHHMELDGSAGHSYYAVERGKLEELRGHIISCWSTREPLALSERAPKTSRLFFDIDTNKRAGDAEIPLRSIIDFVRGLQPYIGTLIPEFLTCRRDGIECEGGREDQGWAFMPPSYEDGGGTTFGDTVAYVLESYLGKTTSDGSTRLGTYHVVFPLLFGDRATVYRELSSAFAAGSGRAQTRLRRAVAGSEEVLKYVDLNVVRLGALRAPYCDKIGAGRPFIPAAIVDGDVVLSRNDQVYGRLLSDPVLAFNATTILYAPPEPSALNVVGGGPAPLPDDRATVLRRLQEHDQDARRAFLECREQFYDRGLKFDMTQTYNQCCADVTLTSKDVKERIGSVVTGTLNKHFAFIRNRCEYMFKVWNAEKCAIVYHRIDERDISRILGKTKMEIVWPPRNGRKMVIDPAKIFIESEHSTQFHDIVVRPPSASMPASQFDLNTWQPYDVTFDMCRRASRHAIRMPVNREWVDYCRSWAADGSRVGESPVSRAENPFAHAAFVSGEIELGDDGAFYRRFDLQTFLRHIRNILCGGKQELYDFVIRWFAHVVQRPGIITGSCLIFIGSEGCGKNIVVDTIGHILGPSNYLPCACAGDLGTFNSLLCGKTLVLFDEVDKFTPNEESRLRMLVTQPTIRCEEKHLKALVVDNVANVVCHTNVLDKNILGTVSSQARRWCMVRCADKPNELTKEDTLYYRGLVKWIGRERGHIGSHAAVPGVLALAEHLNDYVIPEDWQPELVPKTNELLLHKLGALSPVASWWHECLCTGDLRVRNISGHWAVEDIELTGQEMNELYMNSYLLSKQGRAADRSEREYTCFKHQMKGLGAYKMSQPRTATGLRPRVFVLLALPVCRRNFARFLNIPFCELHEEWVFEDAQERDAPSVVDRQTPATPYPLVGIDEQSQCVLALHPSPSLPPPQTAAPATCTCTTAACTCGLAAAALAADAASAAAFAAADIIRTPSPPTLPPPPSRRLPSRPPTPPGWRAPAPVFDPVPPDDEDGNAQGLVAMFRPDRSHVPVPRVGEIASSSEEESSGSEEDKESGEESVEEVEVCDNNTVTLGELMQAASAFDAEDRAREERRRIRRLQSAPVPADREVGSSDEEDEESEKEGAGNRFVDDACSEEDDEEGGDGRPEKKKQKK